MHQFVVERDALIVHSRMDVLQYQANPLFQKQKQNLFVLFIKSIDFLYLFDDSLTSKLCNRLANSIDGFIEPRAVGKTNRSLSIFCVNLLAFFSSNSCFPLQ